MYLDDDYTQWNWDREEPEEDWLAGPLVSEEEIMEPWTDGVCGDWC